MHLALVAPGECARVERGEVKDAVDLPHGLAHELLVPDVAEHHLQAAARAARGRPRRARAAVVRLQVAERPGRQIVEDPDDDVGFEQAVDEVRPEEAGAAGDEGDGHGRA